MATRFTKTNLIAELEELNAKMKKNGCNNSMRYHSRNGYHAVDLMNENGKMIRTVDCNELPRVLAEKAELEAEYQISEVKRIQMAQAA